MTDWLNSFLCTEQFQLFIWTSIFIYRNGGTKNKFYMASHIFHVSCILHSKWKTLTIDDGAFFCPIFLPYICRSTSYKTNINFSIVCIIYIWGDSFSILAAHYINGSVFRMQKFLKFNIKMIYLQRIPNFISCNTTRGTLRRYLFQNFALQFENISLFDEGTVLIRFFFFFVSLHLKQKRK